MADEKKFLCNHFNEFNFILRADLCVGSFDCVPYVCARINACLCHQHNSFMLCKMCHELSERKTKKKKKKKHSMMKIFIDIISDGVWNKMENFSPSQTNTHSLANSLPHTTKLQHLFSLLIDFIAPINEYRKSYNKNTRKTILFSLQNRSGWEDFNNLLDSASERKQMRDAKWKIEKKRCSRLIESDFVAWASW